ncbi:MAG: LPP20 family lipoprotein [Candidatus Methylomirabilia bacterium]
MVLPRSALLRVRTLLLWFFALILVSPSLAAVANAQGDPQTRLMTRRAAKVDALRNLSEQVYGLRLDNQTTVRDFVTQSDVIRTRVSAAIQGAREVDYREMPDGTAEVTVEITLGPVRDILGRNLAYGQETIQAKGFGAPGGPAVAAPAVGGLVVRAKGNGVEPRDGDLTQAEKGLLAKRAAKLDALRNLAEEVWGLRLSGETFVRDYVTRNDDLRSRVQAFIQGARVVSEQQLPDGTYQVEIEIDANPVRAMFGF